MKKITKLLVISSLTCSMMLSGCGGGSGGSSTTPISKTCANGATDYPTCTPGIVPADLQITVPAPPYLVGSEDLKAFNYLNDIRTSLGLGKLAYNAELEKSASNHANYLQLNQVLSHDEEASKPGFTGVQLADRTRFSGYPSNGNLGEVIALSNTKTGAIQRLIDSVYHRGILLNQNFRDIGSGIYCGDGVTCLVMDLGYSVKQRNASDYVLAYPLDGQINVNVSMANESPNPFPDIPALELVNRVGYPISIAVESSQTLTINSFSITESGSNVALDSYILTKSNDSNHIILDNEAYLSAKSVLKSNTTYNIEFSGAANGKNVSKKWSFKTGNGNQASF